MRKFIPVLLFTSLAIPFSGPRAEAMKPLPPTELLAVRSLKIPGAVELSWHAVQGVSEYRVSASRETAENWQNLGTTAATSFQVNELPEGTKYYFRIASNGPSGQSKWSDAVMQYSSQTKDFLPALLLPANFQFSKTGAVAQRTAADLTCPPGAPALPSGKGKGGSSLSSL